MLIDWFTVGAQTLNFLVLIWLLKHFLYKPILDAIDVREKRIAHELADAAKKQKEAEQERDDFNQKNVAFDQQRSELLQQATEEVNNERQRLLVKARADADDLTAKRQTALENEQQNLYDELGHLIRTNVFSITRKTLVDLSNKKLESAIVEVFIKRLHDLQGDAKLIFAAAIKKADNSLLIRSAFQLPDAEQANIQQAINECFSINVLLRFEIAEYTISGIELSVEGQVIAWNIESYIATLEKNITDILRSPASISSPNPKSDTNKLKKESVPIAQLSKDNLSKERAR